MTRKSFLAVLLASLFTLFGSSLAFAETGIPTAAENKEFLKAGIEHAEEALVAAKAEDIAGVTAHAKAARDSLKEINASDAIAGKLKIGRSRLTQAWTSAKISMNKKAPLSPEVEGKIEEAITSLKKVSM